MRTFLVPAVLTLFLSLSTIAVGQTPGRGAPSPQARPSPQGQQDRQQDEGERVILTGCLAKGAKANQYEIADQASKKKFAFPGPAQLDQFINQTVRLIGNVVDDGYGNKVFQPDSVSRVSDSC